MYCGVDPKMREDSMSNGRDALMICQGFESYLQNKLFDTHGVISPTMLSCRLRKATQCLPVNVSELI